MSTEIKSPTFPESVADGTIANWVKKEGDQVKQDEVIAEIETDKVVLEIVATFDGKIALIKMGSTYQLLTKFLLNLFMDSDENVTSVEEIDGRVSNAPSLGNNSFLGWSLANIGDYDGDEVVQVYIKDLKSKLKILGKNLKSFVKTSKLKQIHQILRKNPKV